MQQPYKKTSYHTRIGSILWAIITSFVIWVFPLSHPITNNFVRKNNFLTRNSQEKLITCKICANILPKINAKTNICGRCISNKPFFDETFYLFRFKSEYKKIISDFKFNQKNLYLAPLFIQLFLKNTQETLLKNKPDVIVYVPSHKNKLCDRGFNQSLELAKEVSKKTGIKIIHKALIKTKNTIPQLELKKKQRLTNLKNSFKINPELLQNYQNIAIIDDVMTTGTTLNEISKLIKNKTQVKTISCWVIARNN